MLQLKVLLIRYLVVILCLQLEVCDSQTTNDYWRICETGSELFEPPVCPQSEPESFNFLPFPYNCRQYYNCSIQGEAICMHCPRGKIWDQQSGVCNTPEIASCTIVTTVVPTTPITAPSTEISSTYQRTASSAETSSTYQTTTPSIETSSTYQTTAPSTEISSTFDTASSSYETSSTYQTTAPTSLSPPDSSTPPTSPNTSPSPRPTTPDPIGWVCPENYDGSVRHPYNCTLYYTCQSDRLPILRECQTGLYFNPGIGSCDYPFNVTDCINGTPPPPTYQWTMPPKASSNNVYFLNCNSSTKVLIITPIQIILLSVNLFNSYVNCGMVS